MKSRSEPLARPKACAAALALVVISGCAAWPAVGPDYAVAVGTPADVLRQRPDLIAAKRRLAAETARVGQKRAQRFPCLTLSGTFGWQAYSLGA